MGLSIKSKEARDLAAELVRITGETMAEAVTVALRERLERERRRRDEETVVAKAMAIARRVTSYPRRDHRSLEELLYDDHGLPRSNP